MKKVWNIVIMVCTLAAAAVSWLAAGKQLTELQAGPRELGPEEEFSQAAGSYISYEAAYPVATCAEECYSGDPNRVKTRGYLVYDEARQTFIYVIVSDDDKKGLGELMRNLQVVAEMREERNMDPSIITGTLEVMDQPAIDRALAALGESEIVDLYADFQGEEAYLDAYFGDEHGQVMARMSEAVLRGWRPADWYCIEYGVINGVSSADIWISVLAIGLNLLIFLANLISLFTGGRKRKNTKSEAGSKIDLFLEDQRAWVEEWCGYSLNRAVRSNLLTVVCVAVILAAIGFVVGAGVQKILTFYLPLSLFFGECCVLLAWLGQKGRTKPNKILRRIGKSIKKQFPSVGAQDDIIEDFLHTDEEWIFRDKSKDAMLYGKLGERYWIALSGIGAVTVVEAARLGRVESETETGSVRSGKVRVRYVSHWAKFFYQDTPIWEDSDKRFSFLSSKGMNAFMDLAEKRAGSDVKITRR